MKWSITRFAVPLLLGVEAIGVPARAGGGEERLIPLSSIITTSPQKGMQSTSDAFPRRDADRESVVTNGYLGQILGANKSGASNIFLVDATNSHDAVRASFGILVGSRSAGTPAAVNMPDPVRGSHWLVAYLGTGPSDPTWWTVEQVIVAGNKVTLTYRQSKPGYATSDRHWYYYWAPLGTFAPGIYELELYDADRQEASLTRRVEVE